jgi:ubiquinone/menaquinone biosynthesis C-methylase UbiE
MSVHRAARGFDGAASVYDRVRPGYPPEAIAWFAEQLGLGPGRTVIDLAAGTGKLTAPLLETGARVVAVEPSEGMLAILRQRVPGTESIRGTAEEIPLPESSADAVVVAQAFHWFANDTALAEIHRVLRPGGALGLVWNRRDLSDPAHAVLEKSLAPWKGDTPRHRDADWSRVLEASPLFEPLAQHELPNDHELHPGGLEDRGASTSFIAALPAETRHEALAEVREFEAAAPKPIVLPHICELFAFARGVA